MTNRYPNLFLAGAPKCGTTSLYDWLAQHPDIYAPVVKEPTYFSMGLTANRRLPASDYLSLYDKRGSEKYAIDGSTHNFYDKSAAANIKIDSPDAKIIIALRHPVEATHSMFHQLRFGGTETISNLRDALLVEEDRAKLLKPIKRGFPETLLYSRVYSLRDNIVQYLDAFGSERVKIVLLDDVKSNPKAKLIEIYNWLGVDQAFVRKTKFDTKNGAKKARFAMIRDIAMYPPGWIGKVSKPLLSHETRRRIRLWLGQKNTASAVNPPIDDESRSILVERHLSDVVWLEELLQRDLSHWKI